MVVGGNANEPQLMLHLGIFLAATGASHTDSLNLNISKGRGQCAEGGGSRVKAKDLGAFRQTVLVRLCTAKIAELIMKIY